jgi:hypothetical protein
VPNNVVRRIQVRQHIIESNYICFDELANESDKIRIWNETKFFEELLGRRGIEILDWSSISNLFVN